MARPRWSVCHEAGAGAFDWSPPRIETDDPAEAEAMWEQCRAEGRVAVSVFDDNGEGEPLDPEQMWERLSP